MFPEATETNGRTLVPLTGKFAGWKHMLGVIVTNAVPSPIVITGIYNVVDI